MQKNKNLLKVYKNLLVFFGTQHWWPAESPFEVMVGAVLTQHTSWNNVSQAITNLKTKKLLSPDIIQAAPRGKLVDAIRPAGFQRQKAACLKSLSNFILRGYHGDLELMRNADTAILRRELLEIKGIGPETADSILLYSLGQPVFVIDSYTRRVFSRHGLGPSGRGYDEWQECFMSSLPADVKIFNEYHALIVKLAKVHCRAKPICRGCPLESYKPVKQLLNQHKKHTA
jgi:endonuclease-3 related protein